MVVFHHCRLGEDIMNHRENRRAAFSAAAIMFIGSLFVDGVSAQNALRGYSFGRGSDYGMMGGGNGASDQPGYGMMGAGRAWQATTEINLNNAEELLAATTKSAEVQKSGNIVVFHGDKIAITMVAVQPRYPDTTFEVAGLVNPTLVVPAGSKVTLTLINMDYGPRMNHGVVITEDRPPYPIFGMMGIPDAYIGIQVLSPRNSANEQSALYPTASVSFTAPEPGTYYYLCQYYDHASRNMYGRFIVAEK